MTAMSRHDPIAFIGCGRVGGALALGLHAAGWSVRHCASRSHESARNLAARIPGCSEHESFEDAVSTARLVFITVPDDAIAPVAASIPWRSGQIVVHACGSHGLEVLKATIDSGARSGSLHPIMAITSADAGAASLAGATFAIDGDDVVADVLSTIAEDLGGRPVRIGAEDRELYHVSCLLVGGYLSALGAEAASLWSELGMNQQRGIEALAPMMRQVSCNLEEQGVPGALAGTVMRGDIGTIQRHLAVLKERCPRLIPIYVGLAYASLDQARQVEALDADLLDEIDGLLSSV